MPDLTPDQIALLIEQDDQQRTRRPRGKKYDFTDRSLTNWFRLNHNMGTCSNQSCESPEEKGGRNRMVSDIDGTEMCRICFVGGWNG